MHKEDKPLNILLVEDLKFDREIFRKTFEKSKLPCNITECIDAEKALELLRREDPKFDVAVIDNTLPGMTGLQLSQAIMDSEIDLPIVFLTGTGSEEVAVEALKIGVDDYIIKGGEIHKKILARQIYKTVRNHQERINRIKAEEKLKLFAKAVETTHVGITITDRSKKIIYTNPSEALMHGYERTELPGMESSKLAPPELQVTMTEEEIENIKNWSRESVNITKEGSIFPVHLVSDAIKDANDKTIAIVTACMDISKRVEAEKALQKAHDELELRVGERTAELTKTNEELQRKILEQKDAKEKELAREQMFMRIFNASEDAILILDEDRFIDCNDATIRMLRADNKKSVLSAQPWALSPERQPDGRLSYEKAKEMIALAWEKNFHRFEWTHRRIDGEEFPVEVTLTTTQFNNRQVLYVTWKDLTAYKLAEEEKKNLEAQLLQAQKMETIGTLAGGIAHDFNNILSPILMSAECILEDVNEGSHTHQATEMIIDASNRARELIQRILLFSRHGKQERIILEIDSLVNEALKLLRSTLPTTIKIKQDIHLKCNTVMADPTQMYQLIMNLCTNAYHAMPESGGVIKIELISFEVTEEILKELKLPHGKYIRLSINDTGHGMDEVTKERIFDPFFTTKGADKGTGLGLSVVHGIVLSHGGEISVESEAGKGSTFHIYLPLAEKNEVLEDLKPHKKNIRGNERILFVDDEPAITFAGKSVLEGLGYEITTMNSALKAARFFRRKKEYFDLVITDYTMPDMTGVQLAGSLRSIRPDIPVIIISGFNKTIDKENINSFHIDDYVDKPLTGHSLGSAIRKVMQKRSEEG
ncbi:MAG: response regulator [Deltaproteobacteria bacterium]|nr:response regulator [Deltaproteobacteria bacterium]